MYRNRLKPASIRAARSADQLRPYREQTYVHHNSPDYEILKFAFNKTVLEEDHDRIRVVQFKIAILQLQKNINHFSLKLH